MRELRPEVDSEGLIEFARELVRIRSVSDPAAGSTEAEAALAVVTKLRSFEFDPVVEEVAPGRLNVITVVEGGSPGKTLLFEGHTDVVTEGDRSEWTVDPYGADIVDGRLYGRGSADMKGGLAAMIFATAAIAEAGPFPGRIVLAVLCDEEEYMIGAKAFVANGHGEDVDGAIICEPEAGEVCTSQKGALRLRVHATGKMAHGAMPHQGRNPLPVLARLQVDLAAYEEHLQTEFGTHPHLGLPYITATTIHAGSAAQMNVIPGEATLTLDVRTVPGLDHDVVREVVAALGVKAGDSADVTVEVTTLDDRPATSTPHDDPVVEAVVAAHHEVTGETPPYGGVPGTTDGTILWRDGGIPVVVYGPGGKWIAHQADEYVELDELVRCADVYVAAATRFLSG